jgi:RNA polymerase sigma factor (sigma-70 family)
MGNAPLQSVIHHLRRLVSPARTGGLTDAQLLQRFLASRDEAAFETLVWRHGAMVLGLCQRVLRHAQDAEDAFQATFLILARKAASISAKESVSSWLYKVAFRLALRARAASMRRAAREQPAGDLAIVSSPNEASQPDLQLVLDEEVNRLPEKYRAPVLLCYWAGKTNEQAAQELGCPKGTILSRLARARDILRTRLTRRGLTLSAGMLGPVLSQNASAAALTPLVESTVRAAVLLAAGNVAAAGAISVRVAAMMEGGLKAMLVTKLKYVSICLLGPAVVLGGLGAFAHHVSAGRQAEGRPDAPPRVQASEKPKPVAKDPLELARQASRAASEGIRSAVGVGTFERYVQDPGEKELTLRTKAKVKVHYDRGKYHLQFDYATKLERTIYNNEKGEKIREAIVDWKPEDFHVIYDGKDVYEITFSQRINPVPCMIEIRDSLPIPDFPWGDVARLSRAVSYLDQLIQNIGKDAIKITDLPNGGYRANFRVKNAPKVRVELGILPEIGFNIAHERVFNEDEEKPVQVQNATWKKLNDIWYVQRLVEDLGSLKRSGRLRRSVFEYETFEINVEVDPKLFTLESVPIPFGARTFDRRPGR